MKLLWHQRDAGRQDMDEKIAQLILDELFSSLENLESQTAAIMQFLKEKGGASDEQLAPYLERAGRASSIKRRAARVRLDYLLSGITNPPKNAFEQDAAKSEKESAVAEAEKCEEKTLEKAEEKDEKRKKDESGVQKNATETGAEQKTEVKNEERGDNKRKGTKKEKKKKKKRERKKKKKKTTKKKQAPVAPVKQRGQRRNEALIQ